MNSDNINRNSDIPLYEQIKKYLLTKIKKNEFTVGEPIPTERELCEYFSVSRHTVRKAIQELVQKGYLYRIQGNGTFLAQNLIENNNNRIIGVIMDFCDEELESKILAGIEKGLIDKNYSMIYMSSFNDYKIEAKNIEKLLDKGVTGLIIMPAISEQLNSAIVNLKNDGFPFVLVDRRLTEIKTDCVMSDNTDGTYQATKYLINLGHRRIGFIKQEFTLKTSSVSDRITGYVNALIDYGIKYKPELIFSYNETDSTHEKDKILTDFIFSKKLTAVLTNNDHVALDMVKICRKHNINIPEKLSIIGFDNLDLVKHLETPLTTVAQFPEEIGLNAVNLLIDKIGKHDNNLIKQIYYPVKLIIRSSCAKL